MMLGSKAIREAINDQRLFIYPSPGAKAFGSNSIDLSIGPFVWRYARPRTSVSLLRDNTQQFVFEDYRDIALIIVAPGESILAHTNEACGGTGIPVEGKPHLTTKMAATSTTGRRDITVCRCAGLGDVGFVTPWTMELHNSTKANVEIPVGAIVAQIEVHEVRGEVDRYHVNSGSYQSTSPDSIDDCLELFAKWTPLMMLPRKQKVQPQTHWRNLWSHIAMPDDARLQRR